MPLAPQPQFSNTAATPAPAWHRRAHATTPEATAEAATEATPAEAAAIRQPMLGVRLVDGSMVFNLAELCHAGQTAAPQVLALVAEGVLHPVGMGHLGPQDWRFDGAALALTRQAGRLRTGLQLDVAATALVLQLLTRIGHLEDALRWHGPLSASLSTSCTTPLNTPLPPPPTSLWPTPRPSALTAPGAPHS
jgi:hypothetical protein